MSNANIIDAAVCLSTVPFVFTHSSKLHVNFSPRKIIHIAKNKTMAKRNFVNTSEDEFLSKRFTPNTKKASKLSVSYFKEYINGSDIQK